MENVTACKNYEYFMVLIEQVLNRYREQDEIRMPNSGEGK
jgi:hypothetical protein